MKTRLLRGLFRCSRGRAKGHNRNAFVKQLQTVSSKAGLPSNGALRAFAIVHAARLFGKPRTDILGLGHDPACGGQPGSLQRRARSRCGCGLIQTKGQVPLAPRFNRGALSAAHLVPHRAFDASLVPAGHQIVLANPTSLEGS